MSKLTILKKMTKPLSLAAFLTTSVIMSSMTNIVNAQTNKSNINNVPLSAPSISQELQAFLSNAIARENLILKTLEKSKLNPNVLFPLEPIYFLTKDDVSRYSQEVKVNITRVNAHKMLNTINRERIKAGKDSLTLNGDLILESSILGKALASLSPTYYYQDCDKYLFVVGPQTVEDALIAFFSSPQYAELLTEGDYSKIGVGCTYNRHIGEKSKLVYNWVITLNH